MDNRICEMKVTDSHWLDEGKQDHLPGGSPMPVRRFLVIHFTSGASAQSSVNFWKTPEAKGASAHLVIDRDGSIIQCRPFNRTCGHAGEPGKSKWKGFDGLNSCSIGIELANAGDSANPDATAFKSKRNPGGFKLPAGVIQARHKNGGPLTSWEVYPKAQLDALFAVSKALTKRYNLDDLIGHEDCSPGRKNDPGPAFPMQKLREACGFRGLPTP